MIVSLAATLAVALLGAFLDLRHRRLPNWLCLALAATALVNLTLGYGAGFLPGAFLHAVIALVLGMILFKLGMIGGGDAKFYSAAALGMPLSKGLAMLGWTSFAGLILLVAMMTMRHVFKVSIGPKDDKGRALVPYGVAIALGYLATLLQGSEVVRSIGL